MTEFGNDLLDTFELPKELEHENVNFLETMVEKEGILVIKPNTYGYDLPEPVKSNLHREISFTPGNSADYNAKVDADLESVAKEYDCNIVELKTRTDASSSPAEIVCDVYKVFQRTEDF